MQGPHGPHGAILDFVLDIPHKISTAAQSAWSMARGAWKAPLPQAEAEAQPQLQSDSSLARAL